MKIHLIREKKRLADLKNPIIELFEETFSNQLQESLWEWAYILNPIGDPIVAIAEEGNEIVGHYAMIPMPFMVNGFETIGYLSMTTMVRPNFQGKGLFATLAQTVYQSAEKHSFVYGFPNSRSINGFKRNLRWDVDENVSIVKIDSNTLLNELTSSGESVEPRFSLNTECVDFIAWRLSKPNAVYVREKQIIYKQYGESIDLMHFDPKGNKEAILRFPTVNLVTSNGAILKAASEAKKYPFGHRAFSPNVDCFDLQPSMLMADIF